ncbi:asparagine synthase-related protein [Haloprofundus halobius]|uniref:asparagine synthase-related protein n=1 Tax=Haloprofundus halobius TaxID=2876194 RepID=UPI001CCA2F53|nr:asparagine synthase-related protein [Haloprofundus halobius]
MPGLTVVRGTDELDDASLSKSLENVRFLDWYEVHEDFHASSTYVGHVGYEEYPVETVEFDGGLAVLEGYLYDVEDTAEEVRKVAEWMQEGDSANLERWLESRDGDFVVLTVDESNGDVRALTDVLARLPTYYATIGDTVVVSRELKFVRSVARELNEPTNLDRIGAAQMLLFGYTLGTRTLYSDVERISPGSMLTVDDRGASTRRVHEYDFDSYDYADRSIEENAEALAELFIEACERRGRIADQHIISLSGGLDSRAVAAGYSRAGVPTTAATFTVGDGDSEEGNVAEIVADELDIPWQLYAVPRSDRATSLLLETKQGMNYLGMSFIYEFFERLREDVGPASYVTGDGGDKVLENLMPGNDPSSEAELVEEIVDSNSIFSLETAAEMTGVSTEELRNSVRDRVRSYPESDLSNRYVHYLLRERGMNWLTHGEDRNRYYYPSVAPFYARPVYEYAMNCPAEQKRGRKLYRAFLEALSPAMVDIRNANFGAPINSTEYALKKRFYEELGRVPTVKKTIVSLVKREFGQSHPEITGPINELLRDDASGLDPGVVSEIIGDGRSYSKSELSHLYTVVAADAGRIA